MELVTRTATQQLAALDAGEVSSVELLDAHLDRLDLVNPRLNLVVTSERERARAEAEAADERRRHGRTRGPLDGLPMTIKDTFEVAGMITTAGAPELGEHRPGGDAAVVETLRGAGAVIWGHTNVPLWAGDHQSYNEIHGLSLNPWDPSRTVGGSSGGAAGALAAGITPIEVGSDIGGSIRAPAHYCGVCGHKPTWGVVPLRGHLPPPPGRLSPGDLGVAGPLARSVDDLELLMGLLSGHPEAFLGVPGGALPPGDTQGTRIGLWLDDPLAPIHPDYLSLLRRLVDELIDDGVEIVGEARTGIGTPALHETYLRLLMATMGADLPHELWEHLARRADAADPEDRSFPIEQARMMTASHRSWCEADELRWQARAAWAELFERVDVVLAPVTPVPAFPHDTERPYAERRLDVDGTERPYSDHLVWAGLATLPGLPATVVPVGLVDGLPVGVQIIGAAHRDRTTLAVARRIEALRGPLTPPTA